MCMVVEEVCMLDFVDLAPVMRGCVFDPGMAQDLV